MTGPIESADITRPEGSGERLQRRAWIAIVGLVYGLAAVAFAALFNDEPGLLEALTAILASMLGFALIVYERASRSVGERRTMREGGLTRILQGLSRSVSPESIVTAIAEELARASGADHVAVARLRQADRVLETTLVAASSTVPVSRTYLPADILDRPSLRQVAGAWRRDLGLSGGPGGQPLRWSSTATAEQVASRLRELYGLKHTLAEPLVAEGEVVGALVLSQRTTIAWPDASRRLLSWAAQELSAALARAYAHEAAETRAYIDALTGLPNRRYLDDLTDVLGLGRRAGDTLGVLMIDIDRFKQLNDRYGHATGDQVLRFVAEAIASAIRSEDTPARYGGEEFAVVLRHATLEQAAEVGERVRSAVAAIPPSDMGTLEPVSVSVGVAVASEGSHSLAELIGAADRALFAAKRQGRDRVVVA